MGKVLCDRADLVAIADAVRYKGGAQGQITLGEMATGVAGIVPVLQDKTVTPAANTQTVTADGGYDGLDTVTVNAMPTATQAMPTITVDSNGLVTATTTQTAGYVAAGSKSATKQLAFQAAKTITPKATSQIAVSSGYYTGGNITVAGDSNLKAENIKNGVSIFGIDGTLKGEEIDYSVEDRLINGTVSVYSNDRVTKIRDYVFLNCGLRSVSFPACSWIGIYAFSHCSLLTSVSFPVCSYIGSNAFYFCSRLTSVSFPACSWIGSNAFSYCFQLTSVSFPVCSYIGNNAFRNCSRLTSVSFPVCSWIGSNAFGDCSQLTLADFGINTISRCYIYMSAFASCSKLMTLILRYSSLATLSNINAFKNTPMSTSTLTGSFGSIYVPASLVNAYKAATNWATYAKRITAIVE